MSKKKFENKRKNSKSLSMNVIGKPNDQKTMNYNLLDHDVNADNQNNCQSNEDEDDESLWKGECIRFRFVFRM